MLGNYSYQDLLLDTVGVTSVTVSGLFTGGGWGFVGVWVDCFNSVYVRDFARQGMFPNPTTGTVRLPLTDTTPAFVTVLDNIGNRVLQLRTQCAELDLSDLPAGVYTVVMVQDHQRSAQRVVKI